ncbi:MAG TPA: hypothetical protein VGM25_02760 [Caulobacteraceae bacterium]|jgi:hypothetical protein
MTCKPILSLAAAAALVAAPALAQGVKPTLAPGIQAAPQFTAPQGPYVVTNGTPLYKVPVYMPDALTGVQLKRGDRPSVLAEAQGGLWLLIGKDGKGIGYAPRSLVCPVKLCPAVKS